MAIVKLRIKEGWGDAGKEGVRIGPDYQGPDGMWWTPIHFDGEEDPDWHKARSLQWVTVDGGHQ